MLIMRVLAGCGWLRLAFVGFCAGVAAGTTFVLAVSDEDEVVSLLGGYAAGILAFALPAALLEWFWWVSPIRRSVLSK
jgi:hypothetical protein